MPNPTADEIITQKHKRNYIQFGGPKPGNTVRYAGQDGQYLSIDGVTVPEVGGVDPLWVPDPRQPGRYRLVGRAVTPADLPSASLMMLEKHGSIPRQLQKQKCVLNLYEVTGTCKDLSDLQHGWADYVLIYSYGIVGDKDLGTRTAWDSDDQIEDTLSLTLADIYPMGSLGFGEKAATQVTDIVVDITYGPPSLCQCGDGSQFIYAVTQGSGAGSPGTPAEVLYSLDGGLTWTDVNIDGIGATEAAFAIRLVGNFLVVLGEDAYYYAELNQNTGAPGSFTKITSGFLGAGSPKAMYVASPRETWFVGDGGYIYKSTNILSGVTVIDAGSATSENLLRVKGRDESLVAVGENGTVIRSTNRGLTWAAVTTAPAAADIQAVDVLDNLRIWVGSSAGYVYYTGNGGETWSTIPFTGSGSGEVHDILFPTDECGFISHSAAGPIAGIFATFDGGESWTNTGSRLLNLPTFDDALRLACPDDEPGVSVNNLAIAGTAGNGTDGIILLGIASRF